MLIKSRTCLWSQHLGDWGKRISSSEASLGYTETHIVIGLCVCVCVCVKVLPLHFSLGGWKAGRWCNHCLPLLQLEMRKSQNEAVCEGLRAQIQELWDRLQIPERERDTVAMAMTGSKAKVRKAVSFSGSSLCPYHQRVARSRLYFIL
jgi:hypothetical protein